MMNFILMNGLKYEVKLEIEFVTVTMIELKIKLISEVKMKVKVKMKIYKVNFGFINVRVGLVIVDPGGLITNLLPPSKLS